MKLEKEQVLQERKNKPQESKESSKVRDAIDLINGDIARRQGYKLDGDTLILGNGVKFKYSKLVIDRLKELGYGNKQNESLGKGIDMSKKQLKEELDDRTFGEYYDKLFELEFDNPKELDRFVKMLRWCADENEAKEILKDAKKKAIGTTAEEPPKGYERFEGYLNDPYQPLGVGAEVITKDGRHYWITDVDELDDGWAWGSPDKEDIKTGRGYSIWVKGIVFVKPHTYNESLKEGKDMSNKNLVDEIEERDIVVIVMDDEIEDYKYTNDYQADAHFAELSDMSDDELRKRGIKGFARLQGDFDFSEGRWVWTITDHYVVDDDYSQTFVDTVDEYVGTLPTWSWSDEEDIDESLKEGENMNKKSLVNESEETIKVPNDAWEYIDKIINKYFGKGEGWEEKINKEV